MPQHTSLFEEHFTDYRIYQRGEQNTADIPAAGHFPPETGAFTASLVYENTGVPVTPRFESFEIRPDGTGRWEVLLKDVPAGGPYRFETRARVGYEFPCVHHLGVGDVWVIAGQSNAGGFTGGWMEDAPELSVQSYTRTHGWRLATHPLGDGFGHSPFLHFAKRLKRELGIPVGLVPVAVGGSPLSAWQPDEGDAPLYRRMMDALRDIGYGIRGMAWYQGCSDTDTGEHAENYGERFCGFVRHMRRDTGKANLPVILAQLNRHSDFADEATDRRWSAVREQQRRIPSMLPYSGVVPTVDLSLSDAIHTSAEGNMKLGERFANAALGMVYGRDVLWQAPDILSAEADSEGRKVTLRFSHVPRGTIGVSAKVRDFTVEDGTGFIGFESIDVPNDGSVTITLSRPAGEDAVVHCGYGADPVHTLRRTGDIMPVLCFYKYRIARI